MKKITKIKRSVRAISPVISVLLMIAIAVAASLVAYAWVSGYMDFTTTKVGKSIQIQSITQTPAVYVKNVGDSDVTLKSCYINGNLDNSATSQISNKELSVSETFEITQFTNFPAFFEKQITVKIVTTDGTSTEHTETFSNIISSTNPAQPNVYFALGTGGASVTPAVGNHVYTVGQVINIFASPVENYVFDHWAATGGVSVFDIYSASTTATVNSAGSLTATFTQNQYSLTVNLVGGGSVTLNPSGGLYTGGTVVTLDPQNPDGWSFSGWSGDLDGADDPATLVMNENKIVTAVFTENQQSQHQVIFTQTGADVNPAVEYSIDGGSQITETVPFTVPVDDGSVISYTYTATVAGSSGTQYVLSTVSPNSPQTVNNGLTITGNYDTQYSISYITTGNVLSVDVPSTEWVTVNNAATGTFPVQVTNSPQNSIRCTFVNDDRPVQITGPTTVTGTYLTEYLIAMASSPSQAGTTTPVVGEHWHQAGTLAISASVNQDYDFSSWTATGDITITGPSTANIEGPGTITAIFEYDGEPADTFSLIVLPDTQYYSMSYPEIFTSQTQWIVDSITEKNIAFVSHVGDLVQYGTSDAQWENADASMSLLDGHVAWGVCPGNHDSDSMYGSTYTHYNTYFGYSRFSSESWYGGAYNNENTNSYQLFNAGGESFLILHLKYSPSTNVLNWANSIVDAHPNHRVIVTTHSYLETNADRTSVGQTIWEQLVEPNADQIFLVLCGHNHDEARRTDTVNGHAVHQVMADYQAEENGGNGYLRILEFNPTQNTISFQTYSPYLDQYRTADSSEFTLTY